MRYNLAVPVLTLTLTAAATNVSAQASWAGAAGGGMFGVRETGVLPRGGLVVGFGLDNFDRDPLGLDIAELPLRVRFGLGRRLELAGTVIVSRAVVISQDQPWPPPPADIYLAGTTEAPDNPYRAVYWQSPYLGGRSSGLLDFVPGDATLGIIWRTTEQHGLRPAIALAASGTIPINVSRRNLERGSGTGQLVGTSLTAVEWRAHRWSWSANVGVRSATSLRTDRIIAASGERYERLQSPVIAVWGVGTRMRALPWLSFSAELVGFEPIGRRTPTLDGTETADLLLGTHLAWKRWSLSVGYRQHLHPPLNGSLHATGPLADAVVLNRTETIANQAFLRTVGAPDVPPRSVSSVLVMGVDPAAALPPGAYRVPQTYTYSTTGNGGIVVALSVRLR